MMFDADVAFQFLKVLKCREVGAEATLFIKDLMHLLVYVVFKIRFVSGRGDLLFPIQESVIT